jgi:phosphatidylinositol-3-phosphatase
MIYLGTTAAVVVSLIVALSWTGGGGGARRAKACLPYHVRVRQAALATSRTGTRTARVPDLAHIVVIMMENKECSQVVRSKDAPYLNRLGRKYSVLRDLYATQHPSFPNYLALTSGSTLGATRTCATCLYRERNLTDQLDAAHVSWKAYMDGMPSTCYRASRAGNYAKRHNPFLFYTDIIDNPQRCANVVPLTQLQHDIKAGMLPRFVWITPNLCNDMHDCGVAAGDAFLARTVPALLTAVGPRGAIIITWDEGTTKRGCCEGRARGGNIPTFVVGGAVRPHAAPISVFDSYSILRTIEDAWRLPHLGEAGCRCTPTIGGIWRATALAASP